jgi:phage gpG-like protein
MANEARKIQQAQIKLQKALMGFVTVMGVEAKNHFVKSFRNQGFTDATFKRWQTRRGEVSGFGVSKKSKGSRAILVKSGDLRRSVRVVSKTYNTVTVGSDLPYAELHNNGSIVNRRAHKRTATITRSVRGSAGFVNGVWRQGRKQKITLQGARHNVSGSAFRMPKRQFIGDSKLLTMLLRDKLDKRIQQAFR